MTIPLLESVKTNILNPVIVFGFAIALITFLWGLVQYIRGGGKHDEIVKTMLYGVMGMAIMASVFGIMTVIADTIKAFMGSG